MRSASKNKGKHHQLNEESFKNTIVSVFFCLACIATITILSLHFIFNNDFRLINFVRVFDQTKASSKENGSCDLFKGRWLPDPNTSLYTNFSCTEMPRKKNCLLNGRKDTDFLNWKWKPDECELPRFSAVTFLNILRGKKMAFIGDSLARNQAESLVCLLSMVETPDSNETEEGEDEHRDITWEFPKHNFSLTAFWSPFLVAATKIPRKRGLDVFDIHLDRVDTKWAEKLPSLDYAVFSSSHWFFRRNYLYEGGRVVGCLHCSNPGTTTLEPGWAIRMVFRAALRAVNSCKNCNKIVNFVRTYSPKHYEYGEWFTGGICNRTQPVEREELNLALPDWGYRKMQVEEAEMAKREGKGKGKGNEFEFLDVTEMMEMRVDGHPSRYSRKGGNDCLHWCLPGPIDTWNELLLERIKRLGTI